MLLCSTVIDYDTTDDTALTYRLSIFISDGAFDTRLEVVVFITATNDITPIFPVDVTLAWPEDTTIGTAILTMVATDLDKTSAHNTLIYGIDTTGWIMFASYFNNID